MPQTVAPFTPATATVLAPRGLRRAERAARRRDARASGPTLEPLRGSTVLIECDECGTCYPRSMAYQYDSGTPPKGTTRFRAVLCVRCLPKYRPDGRNGSLGA